MGTAPGPGASPPRGARAGGCAPGRMLGVALAPSPQPQGAQGGVQKAPGLGSDWTRAPPLPRGDATSGSCVIPAASWKTSHDDPLHCLMTPSWDAASRRGQRPSWAPGSAAGAGTHGSAPHGPKKGSWSLFLAPPFHRGHRSHPLNPGEHPGVTQTNPQAPSPGLKLQLRVQEGSWGHR